MDHSIKTKYDCISAPLLAAPVGLVEGPVSLLSREPVFLSVALPNAPAYPEVIETPGNNGPVAQLFLLGPFGLRRGQSENCAPRIKKAQALLALLALAPRRERTRVWLRDKLWSQSDEDKSSTSLRQLIFELRKDLGGLSDSILRVDRNSIALRENALWIDYWVVQDDPTQLAVLGIEPETELLEGIDIRDEEFEEWLLFERQLWQDKSAALFEQQKNTPKPNVGSRSVHVPVAPYNPEPRSSLGILPNIQQGCDASTMHLADRLLEGIAQNLSELQPVDIYDLRDAETPSDRFLGAYETEYYIRVRTLQVHKSLTLTFFLYSAAHMALEWSQSIQVSVDELHDPDANIISGFVSQNVDRLAKFILRSRQRDAQQPPGPMLAGYTALNMMFRLDRNSLSNTEAILDLMIDRYPDTLYTSLQAYAASFKVGENLGTLDEFSAKETSRLARKALDDNPFNAISLACLGHTMGYVFRDHERAGDLLEKALNLNRNQAFVWDHYALHKLYIGDYAAAHQAAKRAVYLGGFSPISYSYDTTLAMTSTMVGDSRQAIVAARNALGKQPRFNAAKRYLLVNLGLEGRKEEAQDVYKSLLLSDPQFADHEVQKERFRITQKEKETALIEAIKRYTE